MKIGQLATLVQNLEWFDLAMVVQLTGERRETITNQLYRFCKSGKIVSLRRGMYVLAEPYRKRAVQAASLAGALCRPSYLSCEWTLPRMREMRFSPEVPLSHNLLEAAVVRSGKPRLDQAYDV